MKLVPTRFLNGALLGLLTASIAAACGSDEAKKTVRPSEGGAGGQAGGVQARGGDRALPEPAGGAGHPAPMAGGEGGMAPTLGGEGGATLVAMGGAPSPSAGAAGSPDELPPVDCDPVVFADAQLENAIRTAIDKAGPLTAQDIASLTSLDARGYGIATLDGIECFTELTNVDLGIGGQSSNVADLSPLRYLKKLVTLSLNVNPIESLDALAQLPALQRLDLNSVTDGLDLTPLGSAPSLSVLHLESDNVADLTPLGKSSSLKELWLTNSTLAVPNSLSKLTSVKLLYLSGAQLTDATPLASLKQLTELNIDGNGNLTNFNKLSTLTNLTWLDAGYTGISSITAVASMTKLKTLYLYFDQIADISPLQGLTQLESLALNFNPVTDITPLVNNAGLGTGDTINLAGTSLSCPAQGANVTTLVGRGATVYSPCN
ncbi:MAG TPA: leucine-rich repeat domain-containing protein [Polyangiaceae bacterium]|nr:leucine-rich repeat domain-containing protein [Polyangiaceae bacterium]